MSGEKAELQMDEFNNITDYIREQAGEDTFMIFGIGIDVSLGESIRVTVVATAFDAENEGDDDDMAKAKIIAQTTAKLPENTFKSEPKVESNERNFVFSMNPNEKNDEENTKFQPQNTEEDADDSNDGVAKEAKVIFNLDDEVEEEYDSNNDDSNERSELDLKKDKLIQEAEERINRLKKMNSKSFDNEGLKEKLEVPAYLRRNIQLDDTNDQKD